MRYESLPKGDCEVNAGIFQQLLDGEPCGGLLNMVALNAAAALVVVIAPLISKKVWR